MERRIACFLGALIFGCATVKPYQATFVEPFFENPEKSQLVIRDVVFQFEPITRDNANRYSIALPITYADTASERAASRGGGVTAAGAFQTATARNAQLYLIPLPGFAAQIINQSQGPVSFKDARFELFDAKGRRFVALADSLALQYEVTSEARTISVAIADNENVMRAVQESVRNVPLLTPQTELQKGGKWAGFLAFRIGAYGPDEYYPLLRNIDELTLKVSNVRTQTGTIELAIPFPKKTRSMQVTCPGDVKEPSLVRCNQ